MGSKTSEIVVGIDFGTTYSGVSWAVNAGAKTIRLINNWPNPKYANATNDKVPSEIAYVDGKPSKWGYSIGPNDKSFRWIKILLEPDSRYAKSVAPVKQSNEMLDQLHRNAVSIVADYLRLLWGYTMKDIEQRQGPDFRDIFDLRVVMSVPAMWSPAAKDKTLQAAKQAGLGDDIRLVTEPEAAALATLKDKSEMQELRPGDCFVVCDAGGGTVDLISYQIETISPLRIKECAIGNGDLCGSVFLDMGFQKLVVTKIGQRQWDQLKDPAKKNMMGDFEFVKRSFAPATQKEYAVELRGVKDDNASGIQEENISFKESAIRTIFDHVGLQIDRLVSQQIDQVTSKRNRKVKAILLVGGFGESDYLYDLLKNAHQREGAVVLKVNGAWSAICRGATMWGLEHSKYQLFQPKTVSSRIARYSYGVDVSWPFDSTRHRQEDKFWHDARGGWYAGNQMLWLVRRGDSLDDGQIEVTSIRHSLAGIGLLTNGWRHFEKQLLYSDEKVPPSVSTHTSVRKLCSVEYSINVSRIWAKTSSYKTNGVKWRDVVFELSILLGNADLAFSVEYNKQVVAACEAKYPES